MIEEGYYIKAGEEYKITHTPSQAATLTGFEDYPHFSKTFKRLVGKSPKEYRADALG